MSIQENFSNQFDLLPKGLVGHWIYHRPHIWQISLLNQRSFSQFLKDKGVESFSSHDIETLWQVGLLRADLIFSDTPLDVSGVKLLCEDATSSLVYIDQRSYLFEHSLADVAVDVDDFHANTELLIHPFHYFVTRFLEQNLQFATHPMQPLEYSKGSQEVLTRWQERFTNSSTTAGYARQLHYLTQIIELCIATEPLVFRDIFQKLID